MRSRLLVLACACTLSLAGVADAQSVAVGEATARAPGMRAKSSEIEVRAKIVELDQARRSAVLRGPKGKLFTVDVPAEVKNFDQVRVGDDLVVRYVVAVAAALEPVSKRSGIRERVETAASSQAPSGGLPGSASGRMVEVLAVIEALDRKARTATLKGAKRTVTVAVPEGVDMTRLKVGDEVRAAFAEAAVISVESAAAR
ncbi:MAG: hypothetical protein Q8L12_13705 [Methylibium sp.]|nr:hypothetical protein [Methylibium sp.]